MLRVGEARNLVVLSVALFASVPMARAADFDPAVLRGIQFLRSHAAAQRIGETALTGLALVKAEVAPNDPTLAACVAKVRTRFKNGVYVPERNIGSDIYEAAVVGMLLANVDAQTYRPDLMMIAAYLSGKQKAGGGWDYDNRDRGDTSISQYAILGLWEAENAGADVHPSVWERAAQWFLSSQSAEGSWNYHRDEASHPESISMTVAGMGSLLICQRQLTRYRRTGDAPSPLLVALVPEGTIYEVKLSFGRVDQAVRRAQSWLASNFNLEKGPTFGLSIYYGLYGIERIVALTARETFGRTNVYEQGRRYILQTQRADGGWSGTAELGDDVNTVWSVLFLTRSTAKTIKRIQVRRLGAGTLLGGRGLPKDLSAMTIAGGRVVSRPMNGAVEGMLEVLEDPRAQDADSALAGLVTRYQTEGSKILRPHKDRFRKLLTDRDPGLRKVAAWGLGRTGDLDVVPNLIDALADPDEEVVDTARIGLQLLGRKVEGFGPSAGSTPEERREAAKKWRAWYDTIRPLELEGQQEGDLPPPSDASRRAK